MLSREGSLETLAYIKNTAEGTDNPNETGDGDAVITAGSENAAPADPGVDGAAENTDDQNREGTAESQDNGTQASGNKVSRGISIPWLAL